MKYLFYDVETPNRRNNSICALGWVLYEDNAKISHAYQLIDPKAEFDLFNIRIHGITPADVKGAPTIGEYWSDTLESLMTSSIVIAHSAGFDISVTSKALASEGIEFPAIKFYDSVPAFRALYPDIRCKLSEFASYFGFIYRAHHAGEDATMLADVMSAICKEKDFLDFSELFEAANTSFQSLHVQQEESSSDPWEEQYKNYLNTLQDVIQRGKSKNVDLSNIHFGFHGFLQDPVIWRKDGLDKIVEALGGVFLENVSGKLDYYVCFDDEETNTVLKARSISENPRYHLQIIDTEAFLKIIGYLPGDADHDGPSAIRARKQQEQEEKEAANREKELALAQKAARKAEREAKMAEKESRRSEQQSRGRAVRQLDMDGNVIAEYPSIALAVAAVGTNAKSIRDVLSGKQKKAGGYRWESV